MDSVSLTARGAVRRTPTSVARGAIHASMAARTSTPITQAHANERPVDHIAGMAPRAASSAVQPVRYMG